MKKKLEYTGIAIIIFGFLTWILSVFLANYVLKKEYLAELGQGIKFEALSESMQPLYDKHFSSNIHFIAALRDQFDVANEKIYENYAVDSADIKKILSAADNEVKINLSKEMLESPQNENLRAFLESQGSDFLDKTFESNEALRTNLQSLSKDYNNQIQWTQAFDSYTEGTLIFKLTKSSSIGSVPANSKLWLFLSIGMIIIGAVVFFGSAYIGETAGIKHNNIYKNPATSLGWLGIIMGSFMILFYVILYFYPEYLTNWVIMVDPLSKMLNGSPASHWFLYGFLYTLAILVMGVRMFFKYRHSKYHIIRTISVMFFQLAFAFIIPEILAALNKPGYDFKNIWPLDYDFFYSYNLEQLMGSGALGWFMLIWGILLIIIAVPFLTYFLGKRWYCSWVCGCGGLAETLGDPWRQLSDKSLKAWKIERWLVHGVLVFAVINTAGVLYAFFTGSGTFLGVPTEGVKSAYGFLISSIFAGVVGTGFYPLMGNRVWCRFGCPLAAYLGLVQRFKSRFRITTNGGQCISCGNCSTYCEMGIDVRWYAQRGQNIVRSSCVGCGVCAAVCPRGVLRLENGPEEGRFGEEGLLGNEAEKRVLS